MAKIIDKGLKTPDDPDPFDGSFEIYSPKWRINPPKNSSASTKKTKDRSRSSTSKKTNKP